ncbi:MAG: serine/threonine protein kinase [Myxococcales bacterium]|nr:serine/threonine protein kinase [Myxococcales bacterium]
MAPSEPTAGHPTRVGRYEVISHLATGGMAQIYLARQSGLGSFERHVVLKTILRERASDQRFVTMFLDEAKLAATLNHQNVAQVYEVDQADGAYFMAMEYVHGENARAILETTLRRGWTIPLELAVMIISGAGAGLHHAHERRGKGGAPLNIVHRDVSPANIMVGYDGSVKVLDFGIAKAEERATKTVGGTIKGKYGYMSPEQCKGKPIDRRSDIFALGIVLYELTTLRRAFKGNDDFETMKRIVAGDVVLPSVAVPGYPRELEAIVLTAMANDPSSRFQSGQELIEALDAFAVRAKLTGSNTAMGRFMTQLFGSKREPWIDHHPEQQPAQSGEKTEISVVENDSDNEKTAIVEQREMPAEALRDPNERLLATQRDVQVQHERGAARTMPMPSLGEPTGPQQHPPARQHDAAPQLRPSPRPPALRPAYPNPQQGPFPQRPGGPYDDHHLSDAEVNMTLTGSPPPPRAPSPHPQFAPSSQDEISNVGSQPLVDDPKLGWSTNVGNRLMNQGQGGSTRLASEIADYRIRSNKGWILIAIFLVLGTMGAVAAVILY